MPGNISWRDARSELGFESGFDLRSEADYTLALSVWRERTVAARHAGAAAAAARLSQVKESLKRRWGAASAQMLVSPLPVATTVSMKPRLEGAPLPP